MAASHSDADAFEIASCPGGSAKAVSLPEDEAFEAHLQALMRALDLQANLLCSALDMHPASPLVDCKRLAQEAVSKFHAAIGDLRSNMLTVAATAAGPGELPATVAADTLGGKAHPESTAVAASNEGLLDRQHSANSSRRSSASELGRLRDSGPSALEASQLADRKSRRSVASLIGSEVQTVHTVQTFGSQATVSTPKLREERAPRCIDGVLNPDWPPRLAWDVVVICLVLCDSVVIPLQLAEFSRESAIDLFWLWLTVAVFASDLTSNFFTGYRSGKEDKHRQEGTLVTDRSSIAINYLRGWFWIDFMSTVPWHVIAKAFTSSSGTSSAGQVTKLAKVIKLTRLLRLMRMLRLAKITVIWERLEGRIGSITALNVVSMCKVLGIWAAICHWGACVWWMVGKRDSLVMLLTLQDDDPEALHWTELPRHHSPYDDVGQWRWVDKPASEQYVFCFYWILGVMRTMPAEVTPITLVERTFVLLFMFFAVMAFAVNVARITQAWFKFSARSDAFKEEMAYVRMHLRSINCGATLQLRTQAYLRHLFQKRKLHAKEAGLLNALPEGLKDQLSNACRIRYLKILPRLQDWTDSLLRRVCDATDVVDYLPGDKVTEKHSEAEAAYVLMRGGLQVYTRHQREGHGTDGHQGANSAKRTSTLRTGRTAKVTVVDEHCLFDAGEKVSSRDTVLALECSEVLRIDRRMFQEALVLLSTPAAQGQERHQRPAGNRTISFGSAGSRASPVRMTPTTDTYHTAHTRFSIDSEVESFVEDPDEEDGGLRHGRPAGVQQALEVNAARTSAGWQHTAAAQTMA